jgi:hypothetical protein
MRAKRSQGVWDYLWETSQMAVTLAQLTSYFTNANAGSAPTAAQTAALTGIFNQNATSALSDAAAYQAALNLGSDATTAVSVQTYQYFLGFAPSQAGLAALNAAYVGAGSQAGFNPENRYIAQSVSLALQNPTAKAAFEAKVGSLSFSDAATLVYNEIVGSTAAAAAGLNVPAAVAFLTSASAIEYYTNFVKVNAGLGANPSAADVNLAVKAALVGAIMNAATAFNGGAGVGSYAVAANNLVTDLADDGVLTANNAAGINLFASYGTIPVIPTPPVTYTLSVDSPTVTEGNSGTKVITFTLNLGAAPSEAITVNYQTLTTGTATSGEDFVADAGVVTFVAGQSVATVSVTVNGDTAFEANETVLVKFTGTRLAGEVTATGTINNDDVNPATQPVNKALTVSATDVVEGAGGDDVFIGQVGTTTTLHASDKVSGGAGADLLRVVTDAAAATTIQGFTVTGVETLEVQAQGAAATVGLENVDSALATIRSSSSNAALTVKNVGQLVGVEIVNALNSQNVTIAYKAAAVSNAADTQNIALNGNAIGALKIGSDNDTLTDASGGNTGIETIAITATGSASSIGTLNSTASTVNVSGTQNLTIGALNGAVTKVGAAGFTGNLNATLGAPTAAMTQANTVVTVESGAGADTLNLAANTLKVNVSAGAGNDTVNLGANLTNEDTVAGGDGADTLQVTELSVAANGTNNAAGEKLKNVSSVETLAFTSVTGGTLNAGVQSTTNAAGTSATAAGVTTYDFQGGLNADVALTGVADNTTVIVNGRTTAVGGASKNISVTNATNGTADTLNVTLTTDVNDRAIGTLTAKHETLNITAADSNTTVTDNTLPVVDLVTIGTITDDDLKTLNVSGSASVTVTNQITAGALTTVNAGALTGNLTVNIDDSDDVSTATAQNVAVTSGAGNDSITIGGANNFGAYTINTGAGNDQVAITSAATATVTHTITTGNTATGGAGSVKVNDGVAGVVKSVVTTGTGNWTVTTSGGADLITTNSGNDIITTGGGNDTVVAGAGNDVITAGNGVVGAAGAGIVSIDAGAGNDTINFVFSELPGQEGLTSADTVIGGDGADKVVITSGGATMADSIFNNWTSVETLELGNGANILTLNALAQRAGLATVVGNAGNDDVAVGEGFTGNLTVNLNNTGNDSVRGAQATGSINVVANASQITAGDLITGSNTNTADTLTLTADNGTANLSGVTKVETVTIVANTGANLTNGVNIVVGSDNVIDATKSLTVNAANLGATNGALNYDGSAVATATKSQVVTGSSLNDTIVGGAGNDSISGGVGNDEIRGGLGKDTLSGGTGNDTFIYTSTDYGTNNADTITDFTAGTQLAPVDKISIAGVNVNYVGAFSSFGAAQGAITQGGGVEAVLDTSTGTLWVDVNDDGTLNANDLQIVMTGVTTLSNSNFINPSQAYKITGAANVLKNNADSGSVNATGLAPDTLQISDTANLSNRVITGFTSVTIDAAANVTMTSTQHATTVLGGGATVTATGNQGVTISNVDGAIVGRADIESYTVQGNSGFTLGSLAQNVTENGGGASTLTFGGSAYTGTFTNFGVGDAYKVVNNTNLSGVTGLTQGAVDLQNGAVTITLNANQNGSLTFANGAGAQTVVVSAADTFNADAQIETYTVVGASDVTVLAATNVNGQDGTDQTVTLAGGTNFTGNYALGTGTDVMTITAGAGLNTSIAGVNGGNVTTAETLNITAVQAYNVTMTRAQHDAFTTVNINGTDDRITLSDAGPVTGKVNISNYTVAAGTNFTAGAAAQNVTFAAAAGTDTLNLAGLTYTGTVNNLQNTDSVVLANNANITGATGVATGLLTLAGGASVTMTEAQHDGFVAAGAFTGAGTDTISIAAGDLVDIAASSVVENYILGNDTNGASNAVLITGLSGAQTLNAVSNDDAVTAQVIGTFTGTLTGEATAADVVRLANGANIAGGTIGAGFVGLTFDGTTASMTGAQYAAFTGTITASATETLTITTGNVTVASAQQLKIENFTLSNVGNDIFTRTFANTATESTTVDISAGGADTIRFDNTTIDTGTGVLNVNGFSAANDKAFLEIGGTNLATSFVSITAANKAAAGTNLATGAVIEVNVDIGEILTPTNDAAVLNLLNQALANGGSNADIAANGNYGVVLYNGGNAYLYEIRTGAGANGTGGGDDIVELVGVLNNVGNGALVGTNFI